MGTEILVVLIMIQLVSSLIVDVVLYYRMSIYDNIIYRLSFHYIDRVMCGLSPQVQSGPCARSGALERALERALRGL